jgi:hypothetical protein
MKALQARMGGKREASLVRKETVMDVITVPRHTSGASFPLSRELPFFQVSGRQIVSMM